jgi:hypothetical protein
MDLRIVQNTQIILDYAQECDAAAVALARILEIRATPLHTSRWNQSVNFHEMIAECAEAVGAEIAVAQYFGIKGFKPTLNTFKNEADVMARLEVKHTKYEAGHLIINSTDRADDVAMLVTGRSPVYQLVGWIPVKIARSELFRHETQDNYWIPQGKLYAPEILRNRVNGHTQG